jgi:hypothetical protein
VLPQDKGTPNLFFELWSFKKLQWKQLFKLMKQKSETVPCGFFENKDNTIVILADEKHLRRHFQG